jgi:hypothetical protein
MIIIMRNGGLVGEELGVGSGIAQMMAMDWLRTYHEGYA